VSFARCIQLPCALGGTMGSCMGVVVFVSFYIAVIVYILRRPKAHFSALGTLSLRQTWREKTTTTTYTSTTTTTVRSSSSTTTSTTTTTTFFKAFTHGKAGDAPYYATSDKAWLASWSQRYGHLTGHKGRTLPRVLLFTWTREYSWTKYVNEVHWKACYAQAHGFDIEFTSSKHYESLKWSWSDEYLERAEEEVAYWAWVNFVHQHLTSGKYDYVYLMTEDTLILEKNFDFPVWAWDRGHDITMMDAYHFNWPDAFGLNINGVLFKATTWTFRFLQELWEYRKSYNMLHVQGAFMENVLFNLGREASAQRRPAYYGACTEMLKIDRPYNDLMRAEPARWIKKTEEFSICFFQQLINFCGKYGFRTCLNIGFSPTFDLQADGNRLLPQYYTKPSMLGPWSNCWRNPRKWWPNPEMNCFAYRWNGPFMAITREEEKKVKFSVVQGKCPDKSFNWTGSQFNPEPWKNRDIDLVVSLLTEGKQSPFTIHRPGLAWYHHQDLERFKVWPVQRRFQRLPRVLIYTWTTPGFASKYVNEIYWKSCYAHAHGFDIVFTTNEDMFQQDSPETSNSGETDEEAKEDENMYGWVSDIQLYLFSGNYDYVFMMTEDSLIQQQHLQFPVWQWDTGNDITLMDQHHFPRPEAFGLNENGILFRPTITARAFLETLYEYRKGFYLQGDNGAFMETVLDFMSREAKEQGRSEGYDNTCLHLVKLREPFKRLMRASQTKWEQLNDLYSQCFFIQLDRLTGGFGARRTKNIGFAQTFMPKDGGTALPMDAPDKLGPWANCWSGVRKQWSFPEMHCFAMRWNRPPLPPTLTEQEKLGQVEGTCPDTTFKWHESANNPMNMGLR